MFSWFGNKSVPRAEYDAMKASYESRIAIMEVDLEDMRIALRKSSKKRGNVDVAATLRRVERRSKQYS